MKFDILSLRPESSGRIFRQYLVEEEPTIGVYGNEPFALRFSNSSLQKIQVKLSLDGTDILTGKLADLDPHSQMWIIGPRDTLELAAWPEGRDGGARFVFRDAQRSVAAHTHGHLGAQGVIAAAVFVEVSPPPSHSPEGRITRSAPVPERKTRSAGPGVGAGEFVHQKLVNEQGLRQPIFSEAFSICYLWWDDLVLALQAAGIPPVEPPMAPKGFPGGWGGGIDLKGTPRPGVPPSQGYPRFL